MLGFRGFRAFLGASTVALRVPLKVPFRAPTVRLKASSLLGFEALGFDV